MGSLSDFEKMLPALSRGEKAQILKWGVGELDGDFPGIDARPDVCGGDRANPDSRLASRSGPALGRQRGGFAGCLPAPACRRSGKCLGLGALACGNVCRLPCRYQSANFLNLIVAKGDRDLLGRHTNHHTTKRPRPSRVPLEVESQHLPSAV